MTERRSEMVVILVLELNYMPTLTSCKFSELCTYAQDLCGDATALYLHYGGGSTNL